MQVNKTITYRVVAGLLVAVFALFNIGLPVIVAACPMEKYGASSNCIGCSDGGQPAAQSVSKFNDRSCCLTVFAADRNVTEFVQAKSGLDKTAKALLATSPLRLSVVLQSSLNIESTVSSSPPLYVDIPVFNSCLLI